MASIIERLIADCEDFFIDDFEDEPEEPFSKLGLYIKDQFIVDKRKYPILYLDLVQEIIRIKYFDTINEINNLRQPAVYYWPLIHMPIFWTRQLYIYVYRGIFNDFALADNQIKPDKYREIKDLLMEYDEGAFEKLWGNTNDFHFDFSELLMGKLRDPRHDPPVKKDDKDKGASGRKLKEREEREDNSPRPSPF